MILLLLVGFLGGLVTGISPCILPVVPVIFAAGAASGLDDGRPIGERPSAQLPALVPVGSGRGGGGHSRQSGGGTGDACSCERGPTTPVRAPATPPALRRRGRPGPELLGGHPVRDLGARFPRGAVRPPPVARAGDPRRGGPRAHGPGSRRPARTTLRTADLGSSGHRGRGFRPRTEPRAGLRPLRRSGPGCDHSGGRHPPCRVLFDPAHAGLLPRGRHSAARLRAARAAARRSHAGDPDPCRPGAQDHRGGVAGHRAGPGSQPDRRPAARSSRVHRHPADPPRVERLGQAGPCRGHRADHRRGIGRLHARRARCSSAVARHPPSSGSPGGSTRRAAGRSRCRD